MNIDPAAIRVLCFGDSNTWGDPPDESLPGRIPADRRWTGVLQGLLGDGYAIIEEGLNGRTVDVEQPDLAGRNGRTYLAPCLESHNPLDLVVLMLGTNDLKASFGREAADIAAALGGLLDDIKQFAGKSNGGPPAVLLVSPIHVDDTQPIFAEWTSLEFDAHSVAKSRQLSAALRAVAEERGVHFADAATVAGAGDDGLHINLESHRRLGEMLADVVRRVVPPGST